MNIKGDFLKLGECDIKKMLQIVSSLSEDVWHEDEWRQKTFDAHKSTLTIKLLFDPDMRHDNPTVWPFFYEIKSTLEPIMKQVSMFYNKSLKAKRLRKKYDQGYFIRVILVRLLPGGIITPHTDSGFSLSRVHRVHVPIVTSEETGFMVGETSKALRAGEIWEINNRHMHAVNNRGEHSRIHLILDYVLPGEKIVDTDGEILISLPG